MYIYYYRDLQHGLDADYCNLYLACCASISVGCNIAKMVAQCHMVLALHNTYVLIISSFELILGSLCESMNNQFPNVHFSESIRLTHCREFERRQNMSQYKTNLWDKSIITYTYSIYPDPWNASWIAVVWSFQWCGIRPFHRFWIHKLIRIDNIK